MLPRIEIETGGTTTGSYGQTSILPLRFKINGHLFLFSGTSAERYAMERDLEDARKCIEASRAKTQKHDA